MGCVRILGNPRRKSALIRASDSVLANNSRPHADISSLSRRTCRGRLQGRRTPHRRLHEGSAAPRTSASRARRPIPSRGVSARSRKTLHSSARRSGIGPCRFSSQTLHCRLASSTASDQFRKRAGGHFMPGGGDRTNRYASERVRITCVSANGSAGHSRKSSVIGVATTSLPSRDWRRLFGLSNHALAYSLR